MHVATQLEDLACLAGHFRAAPLLRRLFVYGRYFIVPWDAILWAVGRPDSLLDLGCGDGLFLRLLRKRSPDTECFGIDHDAARIATARRINRDAQVHFSTVEELRSAALGSLRVSVVSILDVLYAVPEAEWGSILELARELLLPDGKLVIKDAVDRPRWKHAVTTAQEIGATRVLRYTKGAWPRFLSPEAFVARLAKHGFTVIEHRPLDRGYPWSHYLFIATRNG